MKDFTQSDTQNEADLLVKVGKGDKASLGDLYDRYSTVLYSVALRILNNQAEAEDVLQEIFVQIWDKASLYDPSRGKPLTWMMSMTRNKSIDRLRSLQRRYRLHDEAEQESKIQESSVRADAADGVYAAENSRAIRNAVMQLSPEQRQAIEMAYFSGLTQSEIAEKLEEPLGTIKARIRRGMLKLRDILEGQVQ
jgi:RNA polymerase sigma-70 factor (ECF subfamily)